VDEGTDAIDFTPDFAQAPVVTVTFRDTEAGIEHNEPLDLGPEDGG
jgi:hypothetical protein